MASIRLAGHVGRFVLDTAYCCWCLLCPVIKRLGADVRDLCRSVTLEEGKRAGHVEVETGTSIEAEVDKYRVSLSSDADAHF